MLLLRRNRRKAFSLTQYVRYGKVWPFKKTARILLTEGPSMTAPVLRLPANTRGRDFVVGDIHGVFEVLDRALAAVNFDPACDRLISVGDLIDRGPDSHKVLAYLRKPWFHAIRGNHEAMFLHVMRDEVLDLDMVQRNLQNGFGWMLQAGHRQLLAIREAFAALPVAIEIEAPTGKAEDRIGFVHADIPAGLGWNEFIRRLENGDKKTEQIALWSRRRIEEGDRTGVAGIARVFMGHTVTRSAVKLGNCFYIDTGGVFRVLKSPKAENLFLLLAETTAPEQDILGAPAAGKDFLAASKPPAKPSRPRAPKP